MRAHRWLGRHRRRVGDERGQAVVEFAFVALMMIMLILGLVDFARLFLQYQLLTDAAREGARRAVVNDPAWNGNDQGIYNEILAALARGGVRTGSAAPLVEVASPCTPVTTSVNVVHVYACNWEADPADPNGVASVGISVPFDFAFVGPFVGWAVGDRTITLRTWFYMRNE